MELPLTQETACTRGAEINSNSKKNDLSSPEYFCEIFNGKRLDTLLLSNIAGKLRL